MNAMIITERPIRNPKPLIHITDLRAVYLYPIRTGTRERPSFMYWVELKAGQFSPDQWTKRGTALLLAMA